MTILISIDSVLEGVAYRARSRRLSLALTQAGLSKRAGIALGTIKKFESCGKISLESLLKIALVLDALSDFNQVFQKQDETYRNLDELLKEKKNRKRGSIT